MRFSVLLSLVLVSSTAVAQEKPPKRERPSKSLRIQPRQRPSRRRRKKSRQPPRIRSMPMSYASSMSASKACAVSTLKPF